MFASKNFVFLGGSCNPTTWRDEVAIPILKKNSVDYYNPQVKRWYPELIEIENNAKNDAKILFFVFDNQTRSIVSMIEVAELSATNRKLVCFINELLFNETYICGEPITNKEFEELQQSRKIIKNLLQHQGVPVFENLEEASLYVAKKSKENKSTDELIRDLKQNYYTKYSNLNKKIIQLKEIFSCLDVSNLGKISLIEAKYAIRLITGCDITENTLKEIDFCQLSTFPKENYHNSNFEFVNNENGYDFLLNFDQFCYLIAIFDYDQQNLKSCKNQFDKKSINNNESINKSKSLKNNKNSLFVNNNQANTIVKPIQKIIDWFSSISHHPSYKHHNHSIHIKSSNYKNSVIRSNSINNRLPLMNDKKYQNSNNILNNGPYSNKNKLYIENNFISNFTIGEDEVDFKNNKPNNNILKKPKFLYPFQVECRDIYLGGTSLPSKWREEISIPLLRKHQLTYFYQYENSYNSNMSLLEASAILNSKVILFNITHDSRSPSSMLTAALYIAKRYRVVLCIQYLKENSIIDGEKLSEIAIKDYNRGRDYLQDLAKRYKQEVFNDISQATLYAIGLVKNFKNKSKK